MKNGNRVAIVLASTLTCAALATTNPAISNATPCTPDEPYPAYGDVCTGGWGNSCTIGLACSTVPGERGTQNPSGYTPDWVPGDPIHR